MTNSEIKTKIATIKAMKPRPGGRLAKRLSSLEGKLAATNGIDMIALLIG
jgi:hypothetical protein